MRSLLTTRQETTVMLLQNVTEGGPVLTTLLLPASLPTFAAQRSLIRQTTGCEPPDIGGQF